jgi:hypothetical protein
MGESQGMTEALRLISEAREVRRRCRELGVAPEEIRQPYKPGSAMVIDPDLGMPSRSSYAGWIDPDGVGHLGVRVPEVSK